MFQLIVLLICAIHPIASGEASYYTVKSSGVITASGERMNDKLFTCAMKNEPLGSFVLIIGEGSFVICKVNDRGPHVKGRIIDLSEVAIRQLHPNKGLLQVKVYRLCSIKVLGYLNDLF